MPSAKKPVTSEERSEALEQLKKLLIPYPGASRSKLSPGIPPLMELAIDEVKRQYPIAKSLVGSYSLLEPQYQHVKAVTKGSYRPDIQIKPGSSFGDYMSTLRHELAHVIGYNDSIGFDMSKYPNSAYNFSDAGDILNSDIYLPTLKSRQRQKGK